MKNSIRNIIYGFLKYFISIVFPFAIRTVLIYKLGYQYAGITSLFASVLQVLSLSELGFSSAIVYSLYQPIAENNLEKICAYLNLFKKIYIGVGTVIIVAGVCVCPFVKYLIKGSYPSDINIYIVFLILVFNISIGYLACGYKTAIFTASQRDDILSKTQIVSNCIMYFLQLFSIIVFENYYFYVVCMIIGTIANNCFVYLYSKKMFPDYLCMGSVSDNEKKELFTNVGALFGHQLDIVIITSADNIVISSFLGLQLLTIYNNYYYVVSSLLGVLIMIANSFLASIGNSIVTDKKSNNYNKFIFFAYGLGVINVFCAALMLVLYQDFIYLWMGKSMMLSFFSVILITIGFYVRQFRRAVLIFKSAAGLWKKDLLKPYIAASTNLLLNIILVKYIGIDGVVISTIVSMIVVEIPWETMILFKYYFEISGKEYMRLQMNFLIKLFLLSLILLFIGNYFVVNTVFDFVLKCIIFAIIGCLILWGLCKRDKQYEKLLEYLKGLIDKGRTKRR